MFSYIVITPITSQNSRTFYSNVTFVFPYTKVFLLLNILDCYFEHNYLGIGSGLEFIIKDINAVLTLTFTD